MSERQREGESARVGAVAARALEDIYTVVHGEGPVGVRTWCHGRSLLIVMRLADADDRDSRPGAGTRLDSAFAPGRAAEGGAEDAVWIDLAERRIASADGRPPAELGDDTQATVAAIAAADAVVLATPVYRGSMTGTLKNLLDHVPVEALAA